jgi:hypothetical protein
MTYPAVTAPEFDRVVSLWDAYRTRAIKRCKDSPYADHWFREAGGVAPCRAPEASA